MNPKELVEKSPREIAEHLYEMAEAFATKAESIYDADPENNGIQSQPYADAASMLIAASHAWEPDSNDEGDGFFTADEDGDDVGMEQEAPAPKPSGVRSSPWGRRTKNPFSGKTNGS